MHCIACDRLLSDYEATRKNANTGEYLDLCNTCLKEVMEISPNMHYVINPANIKLQKEDE